MTEIANGQSFSVYQTRHYFALAELFGQVVKTMGYRSQSQQDRLYQVFESHAKEYAKKTPSGMSAFKPGVFRRACFVAVKERLDL